MRTFLCALVASFIVSPVQAQNVACGDHQAFVDEATDHGGQVRFQGLSGGVMMQIWVYPEQDTWVALVVSPDGSACVPIAGRMPIIPEPVALGIEG